MGQGQAHHALGHSQEMMKLAQSTLEGVCDSHGVGVEEKRQIRRAIEGLQMSWAAIDRCFVKNNFEL